jgi:hypothetical protein
MGVSPAKKKGQLRIRSRPDKFIGWPANSQAGSSFYLPRSDYIHEPPSKGHAAVGKSEERIIPASAYILAGLERRAALPDDNRPSGNSLAAITLHAAVLRIAVPTVASRTLSLFMCHENTPAITMKILVYPACYLPKPQGCRRERNSLP